jgi:hypothetical protein
LEPGNDLFSLFLVFLFERGERKSLHFGQNEFLNEKNYILKFTISTIV